MTGCATVSACESPAAAWWWFTRERGTAETAQIAAPAPLETAVPLDARGPRETTLPPLGELDPAVRDLVRSLTSSALVERWLEEHFPDRKEKVLNRVRDLRGGKLYDARWGVRGRGPSGAVPGAVLLRSVVKACCVC